MRGMQPETIPVVVQKYGGSSVADVERLRRVAERVVETTKSGRRVCVVVSAMGNTTNDLLGLAKQVSPSPSRRELDMLLSCGERISMALLSMAIFDLGHEAISFTGSQSGIITDDRHSGARILEVRPHRIQEELDRGKIVIVAGFQGVSAKREITTLGRGGSDTTAVALAAALGAEHCEICSDVDGVYSGDPRVVSAPRRLHEISYDEMQELADHGAKVLNPQAVEFARKAGIVIHARATAQAPGTAGGTRVVATATGAIGVTGMRNVTRLRFRGAAEPLLDELGAGGVAMKRFVAADGVATAVFSRDDLPDWAMLRRRLEPRWESCEEELAAATVVGEGTGASPVCLRRALAVAQRMDIALLGHDSSPLRLTLYVAPTDLDPLVRGLHAEFVTRGA